MLKISGAFMVIAAAAAFALNKFAALKNRLALLREMRETMLYISSYISFSAMPLDEIMTELIKTRRGYSEEALLYFAEGLAKRQPAAELWRKSISLLPLSGEEITAFLPFGGCIGMTDRSMQLKTVDNIIRSAEICEERLTRRLDRFRAVDMKLLIMCGIAAAVILI